MTRQRARVGLWLAVTAFVCVVSYRALYSLVPFGIGALIAYAMAPLVERLIRLIPIRHPNHESWRRGLGVGLVYLAFFGLVTAVALSLVPIAAAQIAHFIEHVLMPRFDYAFDFHSGGSSLAYIPSALAARHGDADRLARSIELLKAFGAPVSYLAAAPQGGGRTFTSAAHRQGVVSMGTELGGGGLVTPASLRVAEDGMRRVLAHVGLLQGKVPPQIGRAHV